MYRLLLFSLLSVSVLPAGTSRVALLLFGSAEDERCAYVRNEVLPGLQKDFGDTVDIQFYDTDEKKHTDYFHRLEQIYNDHYNEFPSLFVGGRFLSGRTNIRKKVRAKVRQAVASGHEAVPDTAARKKEPRSYTRKAGTAHLLFFFSPSCGYCTDVKEQLLPVIRKNYGKKVDIRMIDMTDPEGNAVVRRLEDAYNEPGNYTPLVFADGRFMSGKNEITAKLDWWVADIISRGGCEWPKELGSYGNSEKD